MVVLVKVEKQGRVKEALGDGGFVRVEKQGLVKKPLGMLDYAQIGEWGGGVVRAAFLDVGLRKPTFLYRKQ